MSWGVLTHLPPRKMSRVRCAVRVMPQPPIASRSRNRSWFCGALSPNLCDVQTSEAHSQPERENVDKDGPPDVRRPRIMAAP